MPAHDVIDNRQVKLVDQILGVLPESCRARFAVEYFFLSGFEALADQLDEIEELRLLLGNTTSREAIEQLTEGFKRLELARDRHALRAERHQRVEQTGENLRNSIDLMHQTEHSEQLICSPIRTIEEVRLKVCVYTRGRLHAKAYIFDFTHPSPGANGIAIVGSSNLTLAGVSDNTELNVLVHDHTSVGDPSAAKLGVITACISSTRMVRCSQVTSAVCWKRFGPALKRLLCRHFRPAITSWYGDYASVLDEGRASSHSADKPATIDPLSAVRPRDVEAVLRTPR
jgi:phosphatidylserine/phosphatidylglycerophosphate/cardiolipin synthase-like enzyme